MPQKRLPEAPDELQGRAGNVVKLASKAGTEPPENACRQHGPQAGFDPPAPLARDATSALVYELSQRLTAIVNSLGATRRLFAAGDRVSFQTAQQVVDEAAEQAHFATEAIRQFRQASFRHSGDARSMATTMRQSQSAKAERSGKS